MKVKIPEIVVVFWKSFNTVATNCNGKMKYEIRGTWSETDVEGIYDHQPFDSLMEANDINILIKQGIINPNMINDGYHTFRELYNFRMVYNAALFNEWASPHYQVINGYGGVTNYRTAKYDVHKSWRHNDGELCFGGGWFIVVAILPTGQISNHYKEEHWDLFKIPETEKAKYTFDGHTPNDVFERLTSLCLTEK